MSTAPSSTPYTEPWLRGTHTDVSAAARAVLHALELALDDLTKWTAGLTDAEVRSAPLGLTPIAFHLRHIAGSTDRILTYAEGNQLSTEQLAALRSENTEAAPDGEGTPQTLAELLAAVEISFSDAADRIRVLATADLDTPRFVGRKQLPTSIGGAMIHAGEHAARHTGQVVTTAKVIKALRE
ncbi:MAG TPA: DinB family protein [Terracidiphilus sp.]|nr:DinB family protein [Terracidiphilus sp.]